MSSIAFRSASTIVSLFAMLYYWYYKWSRASLSRLPGPPSSSWLYGNFPLLMRSESGQKECEWVKKYGKLVKIQGPLGQNMLLIADPKALQHIYQTRGYAYSKHRERTVIHTGIMGRGLSTVNGETHKRQRKVMLPGFGTPESKSFVPIFSSCASRMVDKWRDMASASADESIIIDMPSWTSRATLDALGEAAFDYKFGALDNTANELAEAYQNLFLNTYGRPTEQQVLSVTIAQFFPLRFLHWLVESAPIKRFEHLRYIAKISNQTAKQLVDAKIAALVQGETSRDILSICIRANAAGGRGEKLEEYEMLSQLRTLLVAGHETTSTTLAWTFFELARRPDVQGKLRKEIKEKHGSKAMQGNVGWSWKDFEGMPYLNAVIKESLRFLPTAPLMYREPVEDDVLPLSEPILCENGQTITELPIPRGVKIMASIAAYQRDRSIFGDDADVFNPDRWLRGSDDKKFTAVGVYANLMSFSAGVRSCIGWRFAVLELQAFVVEMISKLEFAHVHDPKVFRREMSGGVTTPVIEGQYEKGCQLPLRIMPVERDA